MQLDKGTVRAFEFEVVVADLMSASEEFVDVRMEGAPGLADIVAKSADGKRTFVVECKAAQTIGELRLEEVLQQIRQYATTDAAHQLVLALPARLTAKQKAFASSEGVEVWDLDGLARRFHSELEGVTHPVLRPLLLATAALSRQDVESPEAQLLRELRALEPGRSKWSAYQKLVARILERLFCPPLSPPIENRADEPDVNRRDIILPNYAEQGFWLFARQRYAADFVVVDAKNYSDTVGKTEALQVLNYLKRHGAGHLGFIVSRKGADEACLAIAREQWTLSQKMLVVLSDDHVERMLRTKEAGGPAEDVIRQWIEEFRLSM